MTNLSPAAQAVLDACNKAVERLPLSSEPEQFSFVLMGVALEAAADQVVPEERHAPDTPDFPDDVMIKPFYLWLQRHRTRDQLLAIAAELRRGGR